MPIAHIESALVNYCPMGCTHCNLGKYVAEKRPALSLGDIKKIIQKARQIGIELMAYRMGETFLRDDFVEIMRLTNAAYINCNVITSGVGLTKEKLNDIYELPGNNRLTFSLDGDTEEINDAIRFKGSFKRVIGCLEHLRCLHLSGRKSSTLIGISFTLTHKTYHRVKNLHELLRPYPIVTVEFSAVEPLGTNKDGGLWISKEQERAAQGDIEWFKANLRDGKGDLIDSLRQNGAEGLQGEKKELACIELDGIYMNDKGFLYPCRSMIDKAFTPALNKDSKLWRIRPPSLLDDNINSGDDIKNSELFLGYRSMIFGNNADHRQKRPKDYSEFEEGMLFCPLTCCKNNNTEVSPAELIGIGSFF